VRLLEDLLPASGPARAEALVVRVLVAATACALSAFIIWTAYVGPYTAIVQRSLFYSAMAGAGLLMLALRVRSPWLRIAVYVVAVIAFLPGPYLFENYLAVIRRGAIASDTEWWLFVATIVSLFVFVRAYVGWTMVAVVAVALLYAVYGDLVPGAYGHGGYSIARLTSTMLLGTEGLFGLPMGVAAQYIFLFAFLGAFLIRTGLGETFVQLAYALTGRIQGGPGLTAVVSSTMFSSINGSAVAGVVTTGTFTIPLMKRTGYPPKVAGGIEAAASSAGQIMPPVMGAAAFLMAELTGISYATIALSALVPALLYVFAVLVAVRLEAGKHGLARADAADVPSLFDVLVRRGYMLLPLVALVVFLAMGYTPTRSAFYAVVFAFVISLLAPATRIGPMGLVEVCVNTVKTTAPVVAAVAAAGVLIGVLTLTGFALQISGLIVSLGGESLVLVLLLTMVASFLLGLGLPTSAAYLLLAILVAPALERFGIPLISAHMFIFYYGLLSAITPPVALAAYAGASIAGSGPNATAVESIRLGFVKVIVPFLFVYSPGLLLIGEPLMIVQQISFAVIGTFALATALTGWLARPLSATERLALVAGGALLLFPLGELGDALRLGLRFAGILLVAVPCLVALRHRSPALKVPAQ
jgi:TRAP transporter 4TM/12TM fusion protein